eukprot:432172-Rhodomonas_salina.1
MSLCLCVSVSLCLCVSASLCVSLFCCPFREQARGSRPAQRRPATRPPHPTPTALSDPGSTYATSVANPSSRAIVGCAGAQLTDLQQGELRGSVHGRLAPSRLASAHLPEVLEHAELGDEGDEDHFERRRDLGLL